ncbi:MAG: PIN domain-containing protein [Thiothrix sp.]|jgi:predicted nucleic acid-binding protein|nr:MAG: PIN domain-containing protein [Thiothrix sp.]
MPVKVFLDTNIWLYALIQSDEAKHDLALQLIAEHGDSLYSSVQVANEISVNLMRKAGKDHSFIQAFLADFMASYPVWAQEPEDLLTAAGLRVDYHFSYWDSLIVAAALRAGCALLYSEDMQHNLSVHGHLRIVNPFKASH